jgi:hypothetical protein
MPSPPPDTSVFETHGLMGRLAPQSLGNISDWHGNDP